MSPMVSASGSDCLTALFVLIEGVRYRGELLVLPLLRWVGSWPLRVANWFVDPIRWGVPLEIAFLALVAWWAVRRLRRPPEPNESDDPSKPEMVAPRQSSNLDRT